MAVKANYGLGKAYLRLGQRNMAKKHMAIYQKDKSDSIDRLQERAGKKMVGAVYDTALLDIKNIPNHFSKLCFRGRFLYESQLDYKKNKRFMDESESVFESLVVLAPLNPHVSREFASFCIATNRGPKKAVALSERAVEIRQSAENYYVLSQAYLGNQKKDKALTAIQRALELKPNNPNYSKMLNKIKGM